MRKWPFEAELHGAIVGCRQFVGRRYQHADEWDARCKAADAGDYIARQYRLLIVEAQPIAQSEDPGQTVVLYLVAVDHLRLRLPVCIEAVEGVEHGIGVVKGRPVACDDR